MGHLIDTSVFIDAERKGLDIRARIGDRTEDHFFVSVVTASELLHGVHRAQDRATRQRRSSFVESVLEGVRLLEVDLAVARQHSLLWADLASRGMLISPNDIWLAATALAHGHVFATANLRHFERVPGLQVEHWA